MNRASRLVVQTGGFIGGSVFTVYSWDRAFNESTLGRNVRTLYTAALISADYKFNFRPEKAGEIDSIHTRTAKRILSCCQKNGGLYIKFGQQIAQQAAILPPQYNQVLKVMYDRAPVVGYDQVRQIFFEEFGKKPEELFKSFEHNAFASASIAQVHKAELWDGTQVAVKVQKPYIRKQLDYDLFVYRTLCYGFERLFNIPLYWATKYTEKHLRQEVDFEREARNSEKCQKHISCESKLSPYIYVPKVYWEVTSPRILTAEWIEGISLNDSEKIIKKGHSLTEIMTRMVDLFSHQIFVTGFVHCDPHPGNILVRSHPQTGKSQVVVLDHGLYIQESELFRHQYGLFWKALFTMDNSLVTTIAQQWGVRDTELLATATLLRPYNTGSNIHVSPRPPIDGYGLQYASQLALKERAQRFLADTEALPRELIFVGRNMNIVRANNKLFGSPVNRIGRMADWAAIGLGGDWSNWGTSTNDVSPLRQPAPSLNLFRRYLRYAQFRLTLYSFDLVFYIHWAYQYFIKFLTRTTRARGFEETLDESMAYELKTKLGIDIAQVFEG